MKKIIMLLTIIIITGALGGFLYYSKILHSNNLSETNNTEERLANYGEIEVDIEELKPYLDKFAVIIENDDILSIAYSFISEEYLSSDEEVGKYSIISETVVDKILNELTGKNIEEFDFENSIYVYDKTDKMCYTMGGGSNHIYTLSKINNIEQKNEEIIVDYNYVLLIDSFEKVFEDEIETFNVKAVITKSDNYDYAKYQLKSYQRTELGKKIYVDPRSGQEAIKLDLTKKEKDTLLKMIESTSNSLGHNEFNRNELTDIELAYFCAGSLIDREKYDIDEKNFNIVTEESFNKELEEFFGKGIKIKVPSDFEDGRTIWF